MTKRAHVQHFQKYGDSKSSNWGTKKKNKKKEKKKMKKNLAFSMKSDGHLYAHHRFTYGDG